MFSLNSSSVSFVLSTFSAICPFISEHIGERSERVMQKSPKTNVLINHLGVDFNCCLGDSRERAVQEAEHLDGGSGSDVGVSQCPLGMLRFLPKLVYSV